MKVGLFAIGIGPGAQPEIVRATAEHADRAGFATLWVGEHVVLFDRQESKYPYSAEGSFPVAADVDWLDPFIALTFAAAVTRKIRLATGICLLPEHNPVVLAKEVASLDQLSGGRFALGVGIGWSAEEFAAIGVPFERRADRTREYVAAMRALWSGETAGFRGEFVNFGRAVSRPKPARGAKLPILLGGESAPALRRATEYGTGWFGFNLDPEGAKQKIARLRAMLAERGRSVDGFEIIVAPYTHRIGADDLKRYCDAGVDEVVIVVNPPARASEVGDWVDRLAQGWIEPASKLR